MEIAVELKLNENLLKKGLKTLEKKGLLNTENVVELASKCVEVISA